MSGGYMGKLLFVDLSTGKITTETPGEEFLRTYLGGYGIGARLLYDRMPAKTDPLGPENIFGLATGPLTGTPALGGARYTALGKSPLTGTIGDANSGGFFGPALKAAGYDAIYATGIAPRPVYLLLDEGKAELRDASALWGKDSNETEDILQAELGSKIEAACIGQAGEKKALIACVMNNKGRAAGRSGLGAVMGAKGLKAVVARGSLTVPMADPDRARELRRNYQRNVSNQAALDGMRDYGTCAGTSALILCGDTPVKNWGGVGPIDFPEEKAKLISDDNVIKYQTKRYACYRCEIACGGIMTVQEGPFAVKDAHKPEYETLGALGSDCLNDSVESIIKANDLCNRYGLDTISAGTTAAFAIECFENGLLTTADTDGLELRWGNAEAIVALVDKIGRREGIGDLLADGVKVAAEKIGRGAEQFAMHAGGQELPMHSPLFYPGLAPVYQLDATPGRHTQGLLWEAIFNEEQEKSLGVSLPDATKYQYTGKGETYRRLVSVMHTINAAGVCMNHFTTYDPQYLPEFLEAVTGWPVTMDECFQTGERIHHLRHIFNLREGLNPYQLKLPGRILGQPPFTEGGTKGVTIDTMQVAREFLGVIGWDPVTALPSRERLASLGLADLAEDIHARAAAR